MGDDFKSQGSHAPYNVADFSTQVGTKIMLYSVFWSLITYTYAPLLIFYIHCLQASQSGYTVDYVTQGAQGGFPSSFLNQNSQAGYSRFGSGNEFMSQVGHVSWARRLQFIIFV